MLFDGFAVAVATAKAALLIGEVQTKCAAINRAARDRLDECLALMQPLRDAWAQIGPRVEARRT